MPTLAIEGEDLVIDHATGQSRVQDFQALQENLIAEVFHDPAQTVIAYAASKPTHGMRGDTETSLLVHQLDGRGQRQKHADGFFEIVGEEVSLQRGYLHADDGFAAESLLRGQFSGLQGAMDEVVVRNGDEVQVCLVLYILQDLTHRGHAISRPTVNVQVSLS